MNMKWKKLILILFIWLATEFFLNFTGLDEVANYSEYILQINHQHIEALDSPIMF
ncbi:MULTISPECIES: hypothetical protein [Okeania]|uniref:hypothetical protein n=1 Tax=Okeania TaxID=1458928 RepID=UPI00195FED65|nr:MULTISPECIES: hypothetical protein [Okeania]